MHRPTMHRCARALAASVALLTLLLLAVGRSSEPPTPSIPAPAALTASPAATVAGAIPAGVSAVVEHAPTAVLLPARVLGSGQSAHTGHGGGLLLSTLTLLAAALWWWRAGADPTARRGPATAAGADAVDRHWRDGQRPATRRGPPHQPQR